MQLENERAEEERVSRGQASERTVCVCETVSVEKGARRLPLQVSVVCPPWILGYHESSSAGIGDFVTL
jgi:hypothetical protein